MKKTIAFMLTALLVLSLTACGGASENTPTTPKDSSTSSGESVSSGKTENATASKRYADTLTVAVQSEPTSLDGLYSRNAASVVANQHLYDYLVFLDENNEIHPMLAESWDWVSDTELWFHLRKDVVFHNGAKMTADDVVFSLLRVRDLNQVTWASGFIDEISKVDDYTVKITFFSAYSGTLTQFARPGANIVCAATLTDDSNALKTNPIGTGPFKFVQWNQGNFIKLERNDDYWGEKPVYKNLTIRIIPEPAQRLIALENGEVDLAYDIAANDVAKIEGNNNLSYLTKPGFTVYIGANLELKENPISDKRVRQAIQYAIDKDALNNAVTEGYGEVAHSIITKGVFGFFDIPTEYNTEKAKELLTEAGYPNGFTIELNVQNTQTYALTGQIVAEMLGKIGIKVTVSQVDFATTQSYKLDPSHELYLSNWVTVGDAYATWNPWYRSDATAAEGNNAFFRDEHVDDLIQTAKSSFDDAKRLAAYKELEEIAHEELPYIPLYYLPSIVGFSNKVDNLVLSPYAYHRLDTVKIYTNAN